MTWTIHIAGPTEPYYVDGVRFFIRRCARCNRALDLGKVSPLPRFEDGETIYSAVDTTGTEVYSFRALNILNPEAYSKYKPCQSS